MSNKAAYRKLNDRTQNSSTYHKKDGTAVRAKLKVGQTVIEQKGDRTIVKVGEFRVNGKVVICDPCHESREGGEIKASPGTWVGTIVNRKGDWWGSGSPGHERTCMLVACHESLQGKVKGLIAGQVLSGTSLHSEERGVDSGQMAVFVPELDLADEFYHDCCTASVRGEIIEGGAVVCSTGMGDGGYEMKTWTDGDGEVVAVTVKFLPTRGKVC